jgi:glucose 1-dehydrogenase
MHGLHNKTALITGAAVGIGRAIALRLAEEGCRLALADRERLPLEQFAQELSSAGHTVLPIEANIADTAAIKRMLDLALAQFGQLDILVNNAAIDRRGPAHMLSEEDWDVTIDVSLRGAFLCAKYALPALLASQGSIVNISSVNSMIHAPGLPAYSAAKGGIDALTRQMALEYGPCGVRVNAVNPGLIATEKVQAAMEANPEDAALARACYPLDRIGQPAEVAAAVAFLASEEASFITGVTLLVDGGLSIQSAAAVLRNTMRQGWRAGQVRVE